VSLLLNAAFANVVAADTNYTGDFPIHDSTFEGDVTWGGLLSPLPPGVGGVFAQHHFVDGTVDTIRVGVHARPDGPIPASVTLDVYVWADASGVPGTLLGARLAQVRALPPVLDPNGEGWLLAVGFPAGIAAEAPWIGVRVRSTAPSATIAIKTDLDGWNTTPPLTHAPPGAPMGAGWQPVALAFGPLAALAITPLMHDLRPAGPFGRMAGGDGEYGIAANGEWTFDRFDEPPLLDGCYARQDSVGDLPDPGLWALSPESSPAAGVLPAVEDGETDAERAAADVEGHALWFYDPATEGFPIGHRGLFETPELDLEALGLTGGPLALHFLSLKKPQPHVGELKWVVRVRWRLPNGEWGPWHEYVDLVDGTEGPESHALALPGQGTKVQVMIGIANTGAFQVSNKGAKVDKPKLVRVVTGPPPTYKPVPQLNQTDHKHTCMAMAAAACLAYWANNGYPELRESGTTAQKNKKLADSLAKIMEKKPPTEPDSPNEGRGMGGIAEWLKRRGVHVDGVGPPPRKKLKMEHFRDSSASFSRMKHHLSRGHDVILGIRAYKANGDTVQGVNGPWAHAVTLAGITEETDGTKSIRVSDPNGKTIQDEDAADPKKQDKNYPPTKITLEGDGGVQIDAKWKKKGDDIIYKVEEVVVVRPDPENPAPPAPQLVAGSPPMRAVPVTGSDAASANLFSYTITAPLDRPLDYVAVEIRVPYQAVTAPPGWTWEPLPSLSPGGSGCEHLFGPHGIAWRSLGADIPPGGSLSGFSFQADATYPPSTDELDWLVSSPGVHGEYTYSDGPGPAPSPISVGAGDARPFAVLGSVPTPARSRVQVLFSSPVASEARAVWIDAQGRKCASTELRVTPGLNRLDWDGVGENGRRVAAGVYFCRVQVAGQELTARAVFTHR